MRYRRAYAIGDDRDSFLFSLFHQRSHLLRVSKMDDQAVNSRIDQILDVLIVFLHICLGIRDDYASACIFDHLLGS